VRVAILKSIAPTLLVFGLAGGVVAATAGNSLATTTKSVSGILKTVNTKTDKFIVTLSTKVHSIDVTNKTKVTLGGKTSKFGNLKAGDAVTVNCTVSGKIWTATSISANLVPKSTTTSTTTTVPRTTTTVPRTTTTVPKRKTTY
jgi:hypothetical protein